MEIVKHGAKSRHLECFNCGCEFYFSAIDLKKEWGYRPFSFDIWEENAVYCPECNTRIIIKGV